MILKAVVKMGAIWVGAVAVAVSCFVVACGASPLEPADEIDRIIARYMALTPVPGVAVYVHKDGKTLKLKGYGIANLEHNVPVMEKSPFQTASIGKQFTAVAIKLLAERGALQLSDSIRTYFPEAPAPYQEVTIRHLLSHTGGLQSYPDATDFSKDYSQAEFRELIFQEPLLWTPGNGYEYSNAGYILLGYIIEKVTGQFYGHFLHDEIFAPSAMMDAVIAEQAPIIPNRVMGYDRANGKLQNAVWASPAVSSTADGSLYLSIESFAQWDRQLRKRGLLKQQSWETLWTPVVGVREEAEIAGYGLGWFVGEIGGSTFVEHSGDWQGFHNHAIHFTNRDLSVVVLTNLAPHGGTRPREMALALIDAVAPDIARPPLREKADEHKRLTELHRKMVAGLYEPEKRLWHWAGGALDTDRINYLRNVSADIKKAGVLKRFVLVGADKDGDTILRTYIAQYTHGSFNVRFRLNNDDEVLTVRVIPEMRHMSESPDF